MRDTDSNQTLSADNIPSPYRPEYLVQRIAELTTTAEYVITKGRLSAHEIAPQTKSCTRAEWDAMVDRTGAWRKRVRDDMAHAQKELGRMVLYLVTRGTAELAAAI